MNIEKQANRLYPTFIVDGFDKNIAARAAYTHGAVDYQIDECNRILGAMRSLISSTDDKFDFMDKLIQFVSLNHKYNLFDKVSFNGKTYTITRVGVPNADGVPCYQLECESASTWFLIPVKELDKED